MDSAGGLCDFPPWGDGAMTERLDFKQMCARFDVTPRTLRHYEYVELLAPEREGRARFYAPREVARMTLILRGRKFGFSLEEIRQWLELYEADPEGRLQKQAWIDLADRQLAELELRRRHLDDAIAELAALRDHVRADLGS
jgi:DNA-binding transcriptional MerR regulator